MSADDDAEPAGLVAHFFRHEYGRLVAQLVGKVGVQHVEQVEDAVQAALAAALTAWVAQGVPRRPGAWLHTVASNHLIGALRGDARRTRILQRVVADAAADDDDVHFAAEVADDVLRLLFVCCDESIPRESRLVLALKTLCGFSTEEIALRLFTTEANVHKRLQRGRARLRRAPLHLSTPPPTTLQARLPSVHEVLYLLFNEGYLSAQADAALRLELCVEAMRLTTLLAQHPVGAVPETFALLALQHFHAARFAGRVDASGGLLLLEEQDRRAWDQERMREGAAWLARAAAGDVFSRFHAEAGIAAEHCFAPSFAATRWREIVELYALLERAAPSPLHRLNRAVALAEVDGAAAALALLHEAPPPDWLERSHLWHAVLSDLHRRAGHDVEFQLHRDRALQTAPTEAVRVLLTRRLARA